MLSVRSRGAVALTALALLLLLGLAQAEAFSHAHSPAAFGDCAPCRLHALHGAFDLPSPTILPYAVAGASNVSADVLVTGVACDSPSSGRAPPRA
jgi:hypothetical protein